MVSLRRGSDRNNPGPKEAHKQTIFHNHSSREIEGDKMEPKVRYTKIEPLIDLFRGVCPGIEYHRDDVKKSCTSALKVLGKLYEIVLPLKHEDGDQYKSTVEQIKGMVNGCSGFRSDTCGPVLILATDICKPPDRVNEDSIEELLKSLGDSTDIKSSASVLDSLYKELRVPEGPLEQEQNPHMSMFG